MDCLPNALQSRNKTLDGYFHQCQVLPYEKMEPKTYFEEQMVPKETQGRVLRLAALAHRLQPDDTLGNSTHVQGSRTGGTRT